MGRNDHTSTGTIVALALIFGVIAVPPYAHAHDPASAMCSDVHAAAYLDEPEELAELIHRGADLNCRDSIFQTPLITATNGASIEIVEMLLAKGVNLNDRDEYGESALTKARLKEAFFRVQGGETYRNLYQRIIHMLEDADAIESAEKGGLVPDVAPSTP